MFGVRSLRFDNFIFRNSGLTKHKLALSTRGFQICDFFSYNLMLYSRNLILLSIFKNIILFIDCLGDNVVANATTVIEVSGSIPESDQIIV